MTCPIKLPTDWCVDCIFQKENLCDYPYVVDDTPQDIKEKQAWVERQTLISPQA